MVKLVLWCLLLAGLFVVPAVPAASQTGGHIAWGIHFFGVVVLLCCEGSWYAGFGQS